MVERLDPEWVLDQRAFARLVPQHPYWPRGTRKIPGLAEGHTIHILKQRSNERDRVFRSRLLVTMYFQR
jgi:hypothetical protein